MKKRDYITALIWLGARLEQNKLANGDVVGALHKLRLLQKKHRNLATWLCNCDDKDGKAYYQLERIEVKAQTIAESVGLFIEFQRDPRGLTFKLATSANDLYHGDNLSAIFE